MEWALLLVFVVLALVLASLPAPAKGGWSTTTDLTAIERAKREAEWRLCREKLWGRK